MKQLLVIDSIDISHTENPDYWVKISGGDYEPHDFIQKWLNHGYALEFVPSKQNPHLYDGILVCRSKILIPKKWPIGYYKYETIC